MTSSQPNLADDTAEVVRVGVVLADKYRVERVLGRGGMGVVIAATHLVLDERVAIKLMLPDVAKLPEAAQRFLREARAAAKIRSEHVARVSDVDKLPAGTPYMVMEYLTGSDLADCLTDGGPLPVPAAVEYLLQACEALAEAHAAGIVHRDLKPANLFLTRRADSSPCVKVLDFGISKVATGAADPRMTKSSMVMGSPLYMSPEQLRSARDVDARADIWALGAVLHELLSGAPPFDADTIPQLCMKILEAPPPRVSHLREDIPPALEGVIHRCLEKDPARRFLHVGQLADALAPFVSGRARMSAERVAEIARNTGLAGRFEALAAAPGPPASASAPSLPADAAVAGQSEAHPNGVGADAPLSAVHERAGGQGGSTSWTSETLSGEPAAPQASASGSAPPSASAAARTGISLATPLALPTSTSSSWAGPPTPRKRAPVAVIAVGGVALLAGVTLALVFLRDRGGAASGREPPAGVVATAAPAEEARDAPVEARPSPLDPAGPAPVESAAPAASASATPAARATAETAAVIRASATTGTPVATRTPATAGATATPVGRGGATEKTPSGTPSDGHLFDDRK